MVAKGTALPRRIEPDAIFEALFEIRFDAVFPLPEVLFGRFSELPELRGFNQQRRLPAYDMPAQFRDGDPNLRFVPVLELASQDPKRAIRIGGHVLSYHVLAPYPGWDAFERELHNAIDGLFSKTEGLVVNRLGLRYINALSPSKHGINSLADLDLKIEASQERITQRATLWFVKQADDGTFCKVSVATRDFVQGDFPADVIAVIDVDVFTPPEFQTNAAGDVKGWLGRARGVKNEAFLGLLSGDTLKRLGSN